MAFPALSARGSSKRMRRDQPISESLVVLRRGLIRRTVVGRKFMVSSQLALIANEESAIPPVTMPDLVSLCKA
jgi:hypothetical protein